MNKNFTLFNFVALWLISALAMAQTYEFAVHGGGTEKEEFWDMDVDASGNVYSFIMYRTNVSFGADAFTNSNKNGLIVKHDANGNQLFTVDIPSEQPNFLNGAIGVSDDGQIFIGSKAPAGDLGGKTAYLGGFIAKVNNDGNLAWILQPVRQVDGGNFSQDQFKVRSVEVFGTDVYVGADLDADGVLGGVSSAFTGAVLIKLSLDGTVKWIKGIPNTGISAPHDYIGSGLDYIIQAKDGSIYVAGKAGDGSYNDWEVAFVAKFNSDGTHQWTRRTSSSGADSWGVAELSTGDIITGFDVGGAQVIDFGTGETLEPSTTGWLGAMAMFNKEGVLQGMHYTTDALYADVSNINSKNLITINNFAVTASDEIIFLGNMVGENRFNNEMTITSQAGILGASQDAFLLVTNRDLQILQAFAHTGGNNEWGLKGQVNGDSFYFAGDYESYVHQFYGTFQAEFGEYSFPSAGDQDVYIARINLKSSSSVNDLKEIRTFTIYPNPATQVLNIQNNLRYKQWYKIYNSNGQLVKEIPVNGNNMLTYDISKWDRGIYLIRSENKAYKLIKQ